MMNFSHALKTYLFSLIDEMDLHHQQYTKNPKTDFSRSKKWSFKNTLLFILSMEGNSLKNELLKFFDFDSNLPSASSFVQRRAQILPSAFETLFHSFTAYDKRSATTYGYQLIAVDGSSIAIPRNPFDKATLRKTGKDNEYNAIHLNCLYNLNKRLYIDAITQTAHERDENSAVQHMVDRYAGSENTIFIMDRGYECYNSIAHIEQMGMYYIIRGKDITSNGIAASLKDQLPGDDTFDFTTSFFLSKKNTMNVKKHPEIYKRIRKEQTFDFFTDGSVYYPMNIRIVRFPISDTTYEVILTNLPAQVTPELLKELYHKRWGIETSFRELKYSIGLNAFHSKNYQFIQQEIWARLLLYNFCEMITTRIVIVQKPKNKYNYQINYTNAIFICRKLLTIKKQKFSYDIEKLIQRELLPIRAERSFTRKIKGHSAISFIYKIY